MKKIGIYVGVGMMSLTLFSCGSTTKVEKTEVAETSAPAKLPVESVTYDWQGKSVGAKIPDWVRFASQNDYDAISAMPEYKDKVIFFADGRMDDLEGVKLRTRDFDARTEFSKLLSDNVIAKSGNAYVKSGDEETMKYIKEISATFSKTNFSGFKKEQSFWTLTRYTDNNKGTFKDEYEYFVIHSMEKNLYQNQIDEIMGKIEAKTEKEREIKDDVEATMKEAQHVNKTGVR